MLYRVQHFLQLYSSSKVLLRAESLAVVIFREKAHGYSMDTPSALRSILGSLVMGHLVVSCVPCEGVTLGYVGVCRGLLSISRPHATGLCCWRTVR